MDAENIEGKLSKLLSERLREEASKELSIQLLRGAEAGGELGPGESSREKWLRRVEFNLVWLDFDDYTRAIVRAVQLAPKFAGTDYGTSRQRDLAQVWTDTARGFLGELALRKFLSDRFQVTIEFTYRKGKVSDFLPSDIEAIQKPGQTSREPKRKVSIKTTKFNGRWLDLPGDQYSHSDIFVLVKLGILRSHFMSFLKEISFVKDKLIQKGVELGELNEHASEDLCNDFPDFAPIPAYIAGFLDKDKLPGGIDKLECTVQGKSRKKIVVSAGVGLFSLETVRNHPKIQQLDPNGELPIVIDPIIDPLGHSKHFLANSGLLACYKEQWERLIGEL